MSGTALSGGGCFRDSFYLRFLLLKLTLPLVNSAGSRDRRRLRSARFRHRGSRH